MCRGICNRRPESCGNASNLTSSSISGEIPRAQISRMPPNVFHGRVRIQPRLALTSVACRLTSQRRRIPSPDAPQDEPEKDVLDEHGNRHCYEHTCSRPFDQAFYIITGYWLLFHRVLGSHLRGGVYAASRQPDIRSGIPPASREGMCPRQPAHPRQGGLRHREARGGTYKTLPCN